MSVSPDDFRFELLTEHHDVTDFKCGNVNLDRYLTDEALRNMRINLRKTYVCLDYSFTPPRVAGYFTLCADSLVFWSDYLREDINFPLIHLCWFARHLDYRRQGLGGVLLVEACRVTVEVADQVGVAALHIREATREGKRLFLRDQYGFKTHPCTEIEMARASTCLLSMSAPLWLSYD